MSRYLTAFLLLLLSAAFVYAESEEQAQARNAKAMLSRAPVSNNVTPVEQPLPGFSSLIDGPAYGAELLTNTWLRIDLANPAGATPIGATTGDFFGGDFGPQGVFYALDFSANTLVMIDTANGTGIVIGPAAPQAGQSWTGLSYDESSQTMYAVSTDIASSWIYTVDLASGAVTPIGSTTDAPGLIDISVGPTGDMYGHDIVNDAIYLIDKATGAATMVGLTGFDANFAQGMDFNPMTGDLYLAAYNNGIGAAELRLVDLATGNTTLIGPIGAGSGVEVGAFGVVGTAADDLDPNPPANFTAYSDYTNPNGMSLTWDDPTTLVNGTPIAPGDFTIEIERDGAFVASVAGGVGSYNDAGLTDGQFYTYEIYAKLIANDSTSTRVSAGWTAGGSPIPEAPSGLTVVQVGADLQFNWTNPSQNIDGTPMDDFAGINLYEDGALAATFTRTSSDTGAADMAVYTPSAGTHAYWITAIDNESPQNESDPTGTVYSPLALPFFDDFQGGPPIPNPGFWLNVEATVSDSAVNPPTAPWSLTLDGYPHTAPETGDIVTLLPVDLSGQAGNGIVLSYWYQPQGIGNAPESGDSLAIDFLNDLGQWKTVRHYPGTPTAPFVNEVISIDGENAGAGATFFHSGFQIRFRNLATVSTTSKFDHWFIDDVFFGIPSADPVMVVDPLVLEDTLLVGGATTLNFSVSNTSPTPSTLTYTITENPAVGWLSVNPTGGTLASNETDVIDVSLDASGLAAGVYTTDLEVDGNDPANPQDIVTVTLVVNDAPVVDFDPDSLSWTLDPDQQDSSVMTILNNGSGPLDFFLRDEDVVTVAKVEINKPAERRYPASYYGREMGKSEIDLRQGRSPVDGSGGPDNFGYRWIDSDEPGGPTFNWIDITGSGTPVSLSDDDFIEVALPFTFEFYGVPQSMIKIGSNGYLTFGPDGTDFSNDPIPDPNDPNDFIAPFWDDLNPSTGGTIHYLATATEFIVQYTDIQPFGGGSPYTFQVILKADGTMLYQYLSMQGDLVDATIGIEDATGSDGLEIVFNAPYVHDNLAIRIAAESGWVSENPTSGTIPAGGSANIWIIANSTGLLGGSYAANVIIESNDPVTPDTTMPVFLHVTGTPIVGASPNPLVFPDPVFVNGSDDAVLTVTNSGNIDLNVSDITSSNGVFSVAPTSFSIPPFGSMDVTVTFAPIAPGVESGTLTIVSDDPANPNFPVGVEGTGILGPEIAVSPDSISQTLNAGDSTDVIVTIENVAPAGAANLDWSASVVSSLVNNTLGLPPVDPDDVVYGPAEPSLDRAPVNAGQVGQSHGNNPIDVSSIAYGAELLSNTWYRIPLAAPSAATPLGVTSGDLFGGDFGPNDDFYALDYTANTLVMMDTSTGASTVIGPSTPQAGQSWTGLSYDASTGTMFAVSTDISSSWLYTVDLATGAVTPVGSTSDAPGLIDISVGPTGDMYGHDIVNDAIYLIDKATGAATMVGLTGFDANFAQGMDFNPETGDLFLAAYNNAVGAAELRLVDLATGNTVLVGPIGAGSGVEVGAFGVPGASAGQFIKLVGATSGTIAPGDVQGLTVRLFGIDATSSPMDTSYSANIEISSNDASDPVVVIPVFLQVGPTGIEVDLPLPTTFAVSPNYPNPFNPSTTINFQLPEAVDVKLVVYNVLGQKVRTLVNKSMQPGHYKTTWNGLNDAGMQAASGIYIYRFEAGNFNKVQKMILLK